MPTTTNTTHIVIIGLLFLSLSINAFEVYHLIDGHAKESVENAAINHGYGEISVQQNRRKFVWRDGFHETVRNAYPIAHPEDIVE